MFDACDVSGRGHAAALGSTNASRWLRVIPDVRPVGVWPEVLANNTTIRQAFDVRAVLSRDRLIAVKPVPQHLW